MIVRVSIVLKRTVGDSDCRFDNLSGSYLQSQSNIVSSVDGIYVFGQVNNQRHKYHPQTIQYYFDSEDDYRSGCRNVSHCHQQFFSELHSPGRSHQTNQKVTYATVLVWKENISCVCQFIRISVNGAYEHDVYEFHVPLSTCFVIVIIIIKFSK